MSSNITLALVRQASVFESFANGSIQSERIVPGSCSIVLPTEPICRQKSVTALAATSGVIFPRKWTANLSMALSS